MSDQTPTLLDRPAEGRVQRFRRATHDLHEALDARISESKPFADRSRYVRFLAMQRRFHQEIDGLYGDGRLVALLPDLVSRRRLGLIDQDLADLGVSPPVDDGRRVDPADRAAALGWLYVSEGSNLGAAFLLKEAAHLALGENFGARHLAPHPEGRGLNWRKFIQAVDAAELSPEEDRRAEEAAVAAFRRVRTLAHECFGERS